MEIEDRIVVVTGGTGGIGFGVAERWLAAGASVFVAGSRPESVDSALDKLGRSSRLGGVAVDLTTATGAAQLMLGAAAAFGRRPDTLLHFVGGFSMGPIDAPDAAQTWETMISQNLNSAFYCYRAAIAEFRSNGHGWIVGMASRTALQPPARLAAYSASKAGLIALTRSLAAETLSDGIHVNAIITSTVDTPANRASIGERKADSWVTVGDIADTTQFLCSEQARSISGAVIEVYGKA